MEQKRKIIVLLIMVSVLFIACRQDYTPPASSTVNTNFLVVEGFINSGNDTTIITLSRTRSLAAAPLPVAEKDAQVSIQGNGGFNAQLENLNDGRYRANALNLDSNQQYRVSIVTADGTRYASDFVAVLASPPIDSISWQRSDTAGVLLYANTHSTASKGYYRWDYMETWERHAPYPSNLMLHEPGDSVIFGPTETPSICWTTSNSQNIAIASSAKLSSDVISQAPLTTVSLNSEKIAFRYSTLVMQYALTPDAFQYWTTLKKSTELSGSLFDQEPTQIKGNIHCITRPAETTLGFVSVGTVASKRIFISNNQVLPWNYSPSCVLRDVPPVLIEYHIINDYWLPVAPITNVSQGGDVTGFTMTDDYCVDCTFRFGQKSGTATRPAFW